MKKETITFHYTCCRMCPYCANDDSVHYCSHDEIFCSVINGEIHNLNSIPSWCPLEDA